MPAFLRTAGLPAVTRAAVLWAAIVGHSAAAIGMPVAVAGKRACDGRCVCGAIKHTDCCCTVPKTPHAQPSCCQPVAAKKSCCSKSAAGAKASCCSTAPEPEEPRFTWVLAWKARSCHGETPSGMPPMPPAVCPAVRPVAVEVAVAALPPSAVALPVSRPAAPPVPPPKAG